MTKCSVVFPGIVVKLSFVSVYDSHDITHLDLQKVILVFFGIVRVTNSQSELRKYRQLMDLHQVSKHLCELGFIGQLQLMCVSSTSQVKLVLG